MYCKTRWVVFRFLPPVALSFTSSFFSRFDRMTVLASREHACIHSDVSRSFNKNEGWQQLNDQTSESNLVKLLPLLKTSGYFYRPFVPLPIGSQYRTRGIEMLSKHVYGYDGLEKSAIPKIVQALSQWVKFVFTTQEILHSKALQKLLWQGKRKRIILAFFYSQRISTKYDCFPFLEKFLKSRTWLLG